MGVFKSCCTGAYGAEEEKQPIEVLTLTTAQKVAECQKRYHISDSRIKKYEESFKMLDGDQNGTLDTTEIGNAMHFWGENPTTYEIQTLIKKFDENNNGTIEFPEYLEM